MLTRDRLATILKKRACAGEPVPPELFHRYTAPHACDCFRIYMFRPDPFDWYIRHKHRLTRQPPKGPFFQFLNYRLSLNALDRLLACTVIPDSDKCHPGPRSGAGSRRLRYSDCSAMAATTTTKARSASDGMRLANQTPKTQSSPQTIKNPNEPNSIVTAYAASNNQSSIITNQSKNEPNNGSAMRIAPHAQMNVRERDCPIGSETFDNRCPKRYKRVLQSKMTTVL